LRPVLRLCTHCIRERIGFVCRHARKDEDEVRLTRWG
jgi:hypothetical protein